MICPIYAGLDAPHASPLGAYIQSPLGARDQNEGGADPVNPNFLFMIIIWPNDHVPPSDDYQLLLWLLDDQRAHYQIPAGNQYTATINGGSLALHFNYLDLSYSSSTTFNTGPCGTFNTPGGYTAINPIFDTNTGVQGPPPSIINMVITRNSDGEIMDTFEEVARCFLGEQLGFDNYNYARTDPYPY